MHARPIEEFDSTNSSTGHDTIEGQLDGRIRINGHNPSAQFRLTSQQAPIRLESNNANSRQLKDQFNTFNIGYDDDYRNQNRRPYYQSPPQQQPYYPYYPPPQPYPYPYPMPFSTTTSTTTTAKPKPPQPIGYMLIDTYHSPHGQSYSQPIAYFHAKK